MLLLFNEKQENNSFESLHLHSDSENSERNIAERSAIDIEVQPHDQTTVLLGIFAPDEAPRGYSIALNPEPEAADSVIAQVTSAERNERHEFMLCVSNYGNKVLTAEARPL